MIVRVIIGGVGALVGLGILANGLSTGEPAPMIGGLLLTFAGLALALAGGSR